MEIHIKNERTDTPTPGAIGFACSRYITRKLQLHGCRNAKVGNPHPIGWCAKCKTEHDRAGCIEACKQDPEWREDLKRFLRINAELLRYRKHIDLWCWCSPEPCHCDLIKQAILHNHDK